ncbi:MAG: hypothetical protein MZV70_61580 [Desulfobacterales bacterium]|nr:hypothetical protein [Desulfobacterales bacterium]
MIAPLTLLGFYPAGVEQVAPVSCAIFKGIWAGPGRRASGGAHGADRALRGPGPSSASPQ